MDEPELFRKVCDEILVYVEDELLLNCAKWGYGVYQTLSEHKLVLGQIEKQGKQYTPFMYAVTTAVIIGEFAKRAYNDHFSNEVNFLLDELDLDFKQVSGFINTDVSDERFEMLEEINGVGLQDIWETVSEWKKDIYLPLITLYKNQGEKDPDYNIYNSLITIFDEKEEETREVFSRPMDKTFGYPEMDAYQYVSSGFQN